MTDESNDNTEGTEGEEAQLEGALGASQASQDDAQGAKPQGQDSEAGQAENPPETSEDDPQAVKADSKGPKKKVSKPRPQDTAAQVRKAKDVARREAIKKAEGEIPEPADITEEEAEEDKRKDELRAKLQETAAEIEELEDEIEKLKAQGREIMGDLYPHTVESDRHVDAVRGYLKASQDERKNRGAHPARLRELLSRAGKAPIDAAFQRARARGMSRPTRPAMNAGNAPAGDQAHKATPGGQE